VHKFLLIILLILLDFAAYARPVRIVGSSTTYNFISQIAESYSVSNENSQVIIENTGTGAGFNLFCSGNKKFRPGLVMASRKIRQDEIELCNKNNITQVNEFLFGYDGIIFVANNKSKIADLTSVELFELMRKYKYSNGQFENNILIAQNKFIYGPAASSGTRDELIHLIMLPNCKNIFDSQKCSEIRSDDVYRAVGKNENLIIQKIINQENAIGIIGYNYYIKNKSKVRAIAIDGYFPNDYNLANMKYPYVRPLYLYYNNADADSVKFINFILENKFLGPNGLLKINGLVPVNETQLVELRKNHAHAH
jgi:phosphate transport system substrate-binding protein